MKAIITFLLLFNICFAQVLISPSGVILRSPAGDIMCRDRTPDEIAGLVAWYKADGAKTLSGSKVSTWNDKSGNGWDLVQLTASAYPLYVANGINGKPALYFDGNDKLKSATFNSINVSSGYTIFTIARASTYTTSNNGPVWEFGLTLRVGSLHFVAPNSIYFTTNAFNTNCGYVAYYDVSNYNYYSIVFDGSKATNATRLVVNKNSVAQTLTFFGTIPSTLSYADGFVVGGSNGATTGLSNCYVGEIIIYNRTLTASEVTEVHNYIRQKYAM